MIMSTLADAADAFIEDFFHPLILSSTGVKMDELQVKAIDSLPAFTLESALLVMGASMMTWLIFWAVAHYLIVMPFMNKYKHVGWVKPFHGLTPAQQRFYSSYIHGIAHAALSSLLSFACFFYADGKPHTNWFNDNYYKLHTFDAQRFSMMVTVGYFVFDTFFCFFNSMGDNGMSASALQNYAHHILGISGILLALKCDGCLGSICQLTAITEFATLTVDFRVLLSYH